MALRQLFNKKHKKQRTEIENTVIGVLKDIGISFIIVLIIIGVLYAYTQNWPPVVVVQSGSMMRENEPYGKVGTITAGDIVLVKKVNSKDELITYVEGKKRDYKTYGEYGDVIIYKPPPEIRKDPTPVIHRILFWIEVDKLNKTFSIPELNITSIKEIDNDVYKKVEKEFGIYLNKLGVMGYPLQFPKESGFITKGDNNNKADQMSEISLQPIKVAWIQGVARGELPWYGLIKLYFSERHFAESAPSDVWAMFWISLAILIAVPIAIEFSYNYIMERRERLGIKRKKWFFKKKR